MAKLDSVIRHAITPPIFDQSKLHRERLVDELHANVVKKLVAVAAPAGYGKTTLLADFTAHTDLPVCWVRLSEADRDVFRLAHLLNLSLQARFRRMRDQIELENLAAASPRELAGVFADRMNTNIPDTFVIIFDDVHHINSSKPVIEFIDALLGILPEQITIFAAGREVLEVSLARLMADGHLAGLGPQDLALDTEEIIALADLQSGLKLSEEHASRLLEETKGWVTGLILSGELTGGDLPSLLFDARPMVYEYLASVILNRQPEDLRRFMLDSSVFHVMTTAGCNEVLQRTDSQRFLSRLVREGLFLTATNETPRTYEYHPQFREFLLDSLGSAEPKRLQKLRKRAAAYLERQGATEQAVSLFLEAGLSGRAARVAEKHAREYYWQGRWQTLETWQERMAEAGQGAPSVLLYLARYYANQGRMPAAKAMLERALDQVDVDRQKELVALAETVRGHIAWRAGDLEALAEALRAAETALSGRRSKLLRAQCERMHSWIALRAEHDLEAAEKHAGRAVELLADERYPIELVNGLQDLSNVQLALGKARESHASDLRAYALLKEIGQPLALATALNNLGYHAHMGGQYTDALAKYNEALKFSRQAGSGIQEAFILYGQADLFSDLDLALQAAELYGLGLSIATRIDSADWIRYGCVQTCVLHRRRGSPTLAYDWLQRALALSGDASSSPDFQIQTAALEIFSRPDHALEALRSLLRDRDRLDALQITLALTFQVRAALALGDVELAAHAIEEALDWAGANGTEQLLAGEMAHDSELRDFARARLAGHAVLAVVLRRIDAMRAVAQQYRDSSDRVVAADTVVFTALGEARVRGAEKAADTLKPLPKEVLFYLLENGPVDRDVLLERFWPHHPPGRQVANLHTAVYSLRRIFGREAILLDDSQYGLSPDLAVQYDVRRFERSAEIAEELPLGDPRRLFALTEAINSYSGAFLPEFTSNWVLDRRRSLELRYLDLLAQHAQEALIRDQPERALRTLRRALEIDPLRDDTNLHYLEALGRLGRRSELIDHYQRYVHRLSEDLGLDPPGEVRDLYSRLIS